MPEAITVEGLRKSYGKVCALDGIDLAVAQGDIVGLLGPNGAGKTTAIRILATLLRPDAGRAEVLGVDVVRHPERVRPLIGLTGQFAAIDEKLTGFENLRMIGRLFRLGRAEARRRAEELLTNFDLADAAGRQVKTYSGGMRRRLDLAASLTARPQVLFLDEPTTGLDPHSRNSVWHTISGLATEGTTILLTTQYLEEADQLTGAVTVIDHGRVIAQGSPDELKSRVGQERVEITLVDPDQVDDAVNVLSSLTSGVPAHHEDHRPAVVLNAGSSLVPDVFRMLESAGIRAADVTIRRPSLDDVFLAVTGRAVDGDPAPAAPVPAGKDGSR